MSWPISPSNWFAPSLHKLAVANARETRPSVGKFMWGRGGVGGARYGISSHFVQSGGPPLPIPLRPYPARIAASSARSLTCCWRFVLGTGERGPDGQFLGA